MLKIISGRAGTGKTQLICEMIGERIKDNKRSILIVPDPVTYNFEKRLCEQLDIRGFISVDVCSFNRLASAIVEYLGQGKKSFLDDSTKAMAMRLTLMQVEDKLTVFKSSVNKEGFITRCIDMISTLENSACTPEEILAASEKLDDGILKFKLRDMAVIFTAYLEILQRGYTDNADRLKTASALLKDYEPIKDTTVFIDGFSVFTTRLYGFILSLMKVTDVVIALPCADGGEDASAYEISQRTIDDLIRLSNVETEVVTLRGSKGKKPQEIRFIEDYYYANRVHIYNNVCNAVSLNYYASPENEVERIAQKIVASVRNGKRYRDHAIITADSDKYAPMIKTVFARYDIPVYTAIKHDIAVHPVALYVFSALKCAYMGFTPQLVSDLLLSGLTALDRNEKDVLLQFISDKGVTATELEQGLKLLRGKEDEQAEFDRLRLAVVDPIVDLRFDLLKNRTARSMAKSLFEHLEKNGIFDKICALVEVYEANELFDASDITAQIWNKIQSLLESIADIFEDRELTVREFTETLFEGFRASKASTIPSVIDSVTFGDLDSVKEQKMPVVYLIGALEGVIPAVYQNEKLVSEAESDQLFKLGIELKHSVATEDAAIRFKVYSALTSANEIFELSCPQYSSSGTSVRPSPIFKRLRTILPKASINVYRRINAREELKAPITRRQALLNMARDKASGKESKALCELFERDGDRLYRTLKSEMTVRETKLPEQIAKKLFTPRELISISRIEAFAKCPFRHFIDKGIAPEERNQYKADGRDVGNALHSTLEYFAKNYSSMKLTRQECYTKAQAIFNAVAPTVHFGAMVATARQTAFNSMLSDLAAESAWAFLNSLGKFTVYGTEIRFGYGNHPPIELNTRYGTLYLQGKIDRADTLTENNTTFLRIIDYKSGDDKFEKALVEEGCDIQLMIYMRALLMRFAGGVPAAAQYMRITDGNSFSGPVSEAIDGKTSDEEFRALLDSAETAAVREAERMISGEINTRVFRKNCLYCSYAPICNIKYTQKEGEGQ